MGNWDCGGAMPPADLEWQKGKTAASIQFVCKAETLLRQLSTGPVKLTALKRLVHDVKSGTIVVNSEDLDPQVYLVW